MGLNRSDILERIEKGYSLPTLSPVAIKLVELASDDSSSIDDLISLIEKDPSLAVNLLKMANSAFFISAQPVSSLGQAIMRIGFQQVRIMGLSLSLRNTFPMGKVGILDYENFWRISLYRGLLAQALALRLKMCGPEDAFVAGLILEVGLLILYDLFVKGKEEEAQIDLIHFDALRKWEEERFGMNHREIGEAALCYWQFPDSIIDCQRLYSDSALSKAAPGLARVCELARATSAAMLSREARFTDIFHKARDYFDLPENVMNDIILTVLGQVEDIAGSLKLEVDRERDLLELMEKANRTLVRISERISSTREGLSRELPSFDTINHGGRQGESVEFALQAVAHEIRNPLVAVAGFARRLARSLDPASDGGKYAKIILDEAKRLESALGEMEKQKSG